MKLVFFSFPSIWNAALSQWIAKNNRTNSWGKRTPLRESSAYFYYLTRQRINRKNVIRHPTQKLLSSTKACWVTFPVQGKREPGKGIQKWRWYSWPWGALSLCYGKTDMCIMGRCKKDVEEEAWGDFSDLIVFILIFYRSGSILQ